MERLEVQEAFEEALRQAVDEVQAETLIRTRLDGQARVETCVVTFHASGCRRAMVVYFDGQGLVQSAHPRVNCAAPS